MIITKKYSELKSYTDYGALEWITNVLNAIESARTLAEAVNAVLQIVSTVVSVIESLYNTIHGIIDFFQREQPELVGEKKEEVKSVGRRLLAQRIAELGGRFPQTREEIQPVTEGMLEHFGLTYAQPQGGVPGAGGAGKVETKNHTAWIIAGAAGILAVLGIGAVIYFKKKK